MGLIIPNSFASKKTAQLADLDENFQYIGTELSPYLENILIDNETGNVTIGGGVTGNITGNVTGNLTGGSITQLVSPLNVSDGGTGLNTLTTNSLLVGNGANAVNLIEPGTSGNVLRSNGTNWISTQVIVSTVDAQAGTNNTDYLTSLRLREALNASGNAPIYAFRTWVNFDGTTAGTNPAPMTIRGSGNVSSVTRTGTGLWTVNLIIAMPSQTYCIHSVSINNGITNLAYGGTVLPQSTYTTTSFDLVYQALGTVGNYTGQRTNVAHIFAGILI